MFIIPITEYQKPPERCIGASPTISYGDYRPGTSPHAAWRAPLREDSISGRGWSEYIPGDEQYVASSLLSLIRMKGITARSWQVSNKVLLWIIAVAVLAGAITWMLFPETTERWLHYNYRMLGRTIRDLLPMVLLQIAIVIPIMLIECFALGWKRSSLHRLLHPDKSVLNDIWIFLIRTLQIDTVVIFMLTVGALHRMKLGLIGAIRLDEGLLASSISSPVVQMIIYIMVTDFLQYFAHYLHHRLSYLWSFHSYHHSATELTVLTANRGHPIQTEITNVLIFMVPLIILGVPLVSLFAFRVIRNISVFLHHSKLDWSWGWFGKYVLVSPAYHRIHHSILPEHHSKNLAVLLPVWDHLFGTFYKGSTEAKELGIPNNLYNTNSFLHDMILPFRYLLKKTESDDGPKDVDTIEWTETQGPPHMVNRS